MLPVAHLLAEVLAAAEFDDADLVGAAVGAHLGGDAGAGDGRRAHRDAIAVNAGALLYLAGPADNLADGTAMALEHLASGAVARHLESMTTAQALAQAGATA